MATIKDFHQDFIQSILSDAESRGLMTPQSFFEKVCDDLISVGDLTNDYTQAEYTKKGMEVHGFDYDKERRILTLLNHQFFQEENIQTLTKSQIDTKITRLKGFVKKCKEGFYTSLEETSEAYSMAFNIFKLFQKNEISKVRLMVLTDGKATRNLIELPSETIEKVTFDFRVIDIEYLHKIYESHSDTAYFDIQVDLPCLKVNEQSLSYISYLSVITGEDIVRIYEEHGQKLFEQNVRTFLQFRGGVNKGLRNTIEWKPEMFFAFNNGITATAASVDIGKDGNIKRIENFQIVNGGQTTSAIYAAKKNSNISVDKIAVQMKLSVVKQAEKQDEFVSKVAEYANTQNKINNSDFFSNSPFHKEMKDYSNKIYAPAIGGMQRRTRWFYERVRGEYLNSQAYLKPDGKRKFQLENPKDQVVDKTLLSKTEVAWRQRPDIVSKGGQESFKKFADDVTELLEKDNLAITESYFKDAISRVILFRGTERLVTKSAWYDGGYRAQTVAYTISYLAYLVSQTGRFLNFNLIWEGQSLPTSLKNILEEIAENVYSQITQPAAGYANVTQWTKNANCWVRIKELNLDIEIDDDLLVDKDEKKYEQKESKQMKRMDTSINKQIFVVQVQDVVWKKVNDYYNSNRSNLRLNDTQTDILQKKANKKIPVPSEGQSAILYDLYMNAYSEGLDIPKE